MIATVPYPHIFKLDGSPAHLARHPRIRVAQIVMDYLAHGWSPEEMCRQHPYLTIAESHAAMLYYWDHQAEIDTEILDEQASDLAGRRASPHTLVYRRIRHGVK